MTPALVTFLQSSLFSFCAVLLFGVALVSLLIWSESRKEEGKK